MYSFLLRHLTHFIQVFIYLLFSKGLRRLTLNGNKNMGDCGLSQVCEALRDDLWVKALDAQYCGITDEIGQRATNLIQKNRVLEVVDLRRNNKIHVDTLEKIVKHLGQLKLDFTSNFLLLIKNKFMCKSETKLLRTISKYVF